MVNCSMNVRAFACAPCKTRGDSAFRIGEPREILFERRRYYDGKARALVQQVKHLITIAPIE